MWRGTVGLCRGGGGGGDGLGLGLCCWRMRGD